MGIEILKKNVNLIIFLGITLFILCASYYYPTRYVGDTALYGQITSNIALKGRAASNIMASTQDFIDRGIAGVPIEERLANDVFFQQDIAQSRSILKFHACMILYLIAPLCYLFKPFTVVTLAQCVAMGASIAFAIDIMKKKQVSNGLIMLVSLLIISHPGWGLSAIKGAFYPERLFMGTGMYLVWACERRDFNRKHFCCSMLLCMLVGERGALYAGMFVLAKAILYWKENSIEKRKWLIVGGVISLLYTVILMKAVLENTYYQNLEGVVSGFGTYLTFSENRQKIFVFILINILLFGVIAIADWRAFLIAICSMIPNLLYDNGGSEKTGWTLHYHVFYFVVLIWAVLMGTAKINKWLQSRESISGKRIRGIYCIFGGVVILLNIVNPYNAKIDFNESRENVLVQGCSEIYSAYIIENSRQQLRKEFDEWIKKNIPDNSKVSAVEAAMCSLTDNVVYLFPMEIKDCDYAVVTYKVNDDGTNEYYGAVSYYSAEEQKMLDDGIEDMLEQYGYNLENAEVFPAYSLAILHKK